MAYITEMLDIVKSYSEVRANDHVTLKVEEGSIHALLGKNGAGKPTIMSILFGLYQAESGAIEVSGREFRIADPNTAYELGIGIGMVHQHFELVQNFTVTKNIILGLGPHSRLVIDRKKVARLVRELLVIVHRIVGEGEIVLLITHKLKEIMEWARTCTIRGRGRRVDTVSVAEASEESMTEMMVGREMSFHVDKKEARQGEVVLRIGHRKVRNAKGLLRVKDLSLELPACKTLGLCGIDGR